jgi:hypothetical protein
MNSELLKLLSLSRDNNDRLVIYNPENPEKSWAAVSLEDYQKLVNNEKTIEKSDKSGELTDANSGDKIDSIKENDKYIEEDSSDDDISEEEINRMSGDREVYSDPNMPTSVKDLLENKKEKWQIAKQVKNSATEVIE